MNKKINKSCSRDILTQHLTNPETISSKLDDFFANFLDKETIADANMQKRSGEQAQDIIRDELKLRLENVSIGTNKLVLKADVNTGSDTFYNYNKRQMNDVLALTTMVSRNVFSFFCNEESLDPEFVNGLFIVDDTTYKRKHSKKTELASYQFDHTEMKNYLGFRAGELNYYKNGKYLPVNCVPVSDDEPEKLVTPASRATCGPGEEKRRLTQSKMTDVVLYQIDLAMEAGFEASHALFDTWYTSHKMLFNLMERGIHGIGMVKNSSKLKFYYNGVQMSTGEIFEQNRYNLQQLFMDGFYFSVVVEAEHNGERFPVKLFFYESDNGKKEFFCIATTDLGLSARTVRILYEVRWAIECYFADTKDVKTLQSTKKCQAQSIDAVYFDLAMTQIMYIFLAYLLNELQESCSIRMMFQKFSAGLQAVNSYKVLVETVKFLIEKLSEEQDVCVESLIGLFSSWLPECSSFDALFQKARPFMSVSP